MTRTHWHLVYLVIGLLVVAGALWAWFNGGVPR